MNDSYDIVIIGGGPAGLTAGIYASRARPEAILLEKTMCGGQALIADTIENFPGFPEGIKGPDLASWMQKQAEHFGLEIKLAEVKNVILKPFDESSGFHPEQCRGIEGRSRGMKKEEGGHFIVELNDGEDIHALSLIIATGARWNALGVPGEKELIGRGVSYCATCDGPLFKGKDIVVIGGGDTALEDALFLTRFANKVTIVHRRDRLRATKILQERAFANKRIEFCYNSTAVSIIGNTKVEGIKIKELNTNREKMLKTDGVFIFIGISPNSEIVKGLVKMDEIGYIISDDDMRTSVDGIFVCGDVRKKLLRQIVTATGDGAVAAVSAKNYVERIKGIEYK